MSAHVTLPSFFDVGPRSDTWVLVGDLSNFAIVSLPMWDLDVCVHLLRPLQYLFSDV